MILAPLLAKSSRLELSFAYILQDISRCKASVCMEVVREYGQDTDRAGEDDDTLDLVGGLQLKEFLNDERANSASTYDSKRGESRHIVESVLIKDRDG